MISGYSGSEKHELPFSGYKQQKPATLNANNLSHMNMLP